MEERATSITANRQAMEMTVIWADGHTSNYPFSLLRAACPCAQCRGRAREDVRRTRPRSIRRGIG